MSEIVYTTNGVYVVWASFPFSIREALAAVRSEISEFRFRVFPCSNEQEAQELKEVLA